MKFDELRKFCEGQEAVIQTAPPEQKRRWIEESDRASKRPMTPEEMAVVRCLVEMLAPYTALRGSAFLQSEASPQVVSAAKDNGRIYDPGCGSGGSLPASRLCGVRFAEKDRAIAQGVVQSEKFVESHGGKIGDISIYGQDKWARRQRPFGLAKRARRVRLRRQQPKQSNATTRRLAVMNLALRGIEADFGPEHADTFRRDPHPDLRADYVLANPPFNDSDTALRDSAFLQREAKMQVASEAKDNFRRFTMLAVIPA